MQAFCCALLLVTKDIDHQHPCIGLDNKTDDRDIEFVVDLVRVNSISSFFMGTTTAVGQGLPVPT